MNTTTPLQDALYWLRKSIREMGDPDADYQERLQALADAERRLAAVRAIIEAEPQEQALRKRYGARKPKSIKDWWMP